MSGRLGAALLTETVGEVVVEVEVGVLEVTVPPPVPPVDQDAYWAAETWAWDQSRPKKPTANEKLVIVSTMIYKWFLQSVCSANVLWGSEGVSTPTVDAAHAGTPKEPIGRVEAPPEVVTADETGYTRSVLVAYKFNFRYLLTQFWQR